MTWPVIILWIFIAVAAMSRGPMILYLFNATVIFGALTMAPAALTGGLNLPAQTVCAAILLLKIFLRSDNLILSLRQAVDVRKLGLLGFFSVYVVITSIVYPRLFAGSVMLYSLNAAGQETALAPSSANFTQAIYLLVSTMMVFAFAAAARSQIFRVHFMRSVVVAAVSLLASGVINLALSAVGGLSLLEALHNAAYASLDTVSLAGQYRVVGFMPEASVYGSTCCVVVSFLIFNFAEFESSLRRFVIPFLIVTLVVMTFLSTSSTGYLGLITLIFLLSARFFINLILLQLRSQSQVKKTARVLLLAAVIVGVLLIIGPFFAAKYSNLINTVLFQKTASSSYLERSRWTHAGEAAFFSTYGIGVGVGSIRTSNWFVNILASTGIIGVILFFGFVIKTLLPARIWFTKDRRFSNSLILSLLPAVVMIGVSGTTPDPGVWVMSIFGIIYGLRLQPQPVASRPANFEVPRYIGGPADISS